MVNCSVYEYISPQERNELIHILNYYPEMEAKLEYSLTLNMRLGNLELHGYKDKFQLVKLHGHYKRFDPSSEIGYKPFFTMLMCIILYFRIGIFSLI